MTQKAELVKKIQAVMDELARLSRDKEKLTDPELIKKSRELDKLIAEYFNKSDDGLI